MNTNILVRSAVVEDSEAVLNLLRLIADLHRNGRPDMFPNLESKYTLDEVKARLSTPDSGVFVALNENAVVGYIFCEVIKEGEGLTLYIDDLCVSPSARRMGVATALMDHAKIYAAEKKCSFLMLNVWEFNESAVSFYEDYGFTTRTRHLEMPV